jgi:hypothetical protein
MSILRRWFKLLGECFEEILGIYGFGLKSESVLRHESEDTILFYRIITPLVLIVVLPYLILGTIALMAAVGLASGFKAMARALKNSRQGPGGDPSVRKESRRREARRRREEFREETARARGEELDRARSRAFREILGPSGISGPGRDGGGAAPSAGEA